MIYWGEVPIKTHINENNTEKCIILGETALQKCVHLVKLHIKMCILGDMHTKLLVNAHEDLKKRHVDDIMQKNLKQ